MKNEIILIEKKKKKCNCSFLCRDIIFVVATKFQANQKNNVAANNYMSEKVQAELKAELESLSRQRDICRDIAEEE